MDILLRLYELLQDMNMNLLCYIPEETEQ